VFARIEELLDAQAAQRERPELRLVEPATKAQQH
jgi:hypothetical protein